MARFRASIKGNRGEASRLGTTKSGIVASVNGWNLGIDVVIREDVVTGKDVCFVWLTRGSNGSRVRMLGEFTEGGKDVE